MGAGAGAQKITTDVTGNDTAGMVAGMVASGMTAKWLNGIEAEANKLAKAQKGLNGVSKGAESAAEDAGKIVEGGSTSLINIGEIRPKLKTEPNTAFFGREEQMVSEAQIMLLILLRVGAELHWNLL